MTKAAQVGRVETGLNGKNHPRLQHSFITCVQEGTLVVAQANGVPGVMLPVRH
jgi:hypothetical protein